MSWHRYDFYNRFPKSTPREAKGGIKSQSTRGSFGASWWARRWIEVLESFEIGARLGRGRTYARKGQVLSIDISKGLVKAAVQGSRPKPYQVTITVKTLSGPDWKKLAEQLSKQAIFAAKLLSGQMPNDIEDAFKAAKLSLFPTKLGDLDTNCSCPDWSNPCKHIAAVYYLLGEEFDRDPFLLFRLRGIEREDLIRSIGTPVHAAEPAPAAEAEPTRKRSRRAKAAPPEPPPAVEPVPVEPLPADPAAYWAAASLADDFFGEVRVPHVTAALPQRLGSLSFWRGREKFLDAMQTCYAAAAAKGMDVYLGESAGESMGATRPSQPPT
jgi:uncharacterized Zn finger protein